MMTGSHMQNPPALRRCLMEIGMRVIRFSAWGASIGPLLVAVGYGEALLHPNGCPFPPLGDAVVTTATAAWSLGVLGFFIALMTIPFIPTPAMRRRDEIQWERRLAELRRNPPVSPRPIARGAVVALAIVTATIGAVSIAYPGALGDWLETRRRELPKPPQPRPIPQPTPIQACEVAP